MKEKDFEDYTDPMLEECYRIKEELSARFNSVEELSAHLREVQEECRRKGMKVVSYYVPPEKRKPQEETNGNATQQKSSMENTSMDKVNN